MSYTLLDNDIIPACEEEFDQIGVDERLILVNWESYVKEKTQSNDDIIFTIGPKSQYYVDTKKGSIKAIVSSSKTSNDKMLYSHELSFFVLSKTNLTRDILKELTGGKFIVILLDKSTGKYELFGELCGLVVSSIYRDKIDSDTSNGYSISMEKSSNDTGKETRLPRFFNELSNQELVSLFDFILDGGLH